MRFTLLRLFVFVLAAMIVNHYVYASTPLQIDITEGIDQEHYQTGDVDKTINSGFVQTIHADQISKAKNNLADVLHGQAGVQIRDTAGLGSLTLASIRGKSADQLMVYVDGMLLNNTSGGGVDLSLISLNDIETIEVYKDFSPIEFPTASIGGVINIKTHRSGKDPYFKFLTGAGSFNTQKLSSIIKTNHKQQNINLSGEILRAENDYPYLYDNGTKLNSNDDIWTRRRNNEFSQINLRGSLGLKINQADTLNIYASIFNKHQGVATNLPTSNNERSLERKSHHIKFDWINKQNWLKNTDFKLDFSIKSEEQIYDDRQQLLGHKPVYNRYVDDNYSSGLYARYSADSLQHIANIKLNREKFTSEELIEDIDSRQGTRDILSVGLQSNLFFKNKIIIISPALRWQSLHDSLDGSAQTIGNTELDPSVHYQYYSPQIGIRFHIKNYLTIKTNAAKYFRPPSFYELFGARGMLSAQDTLIPESGLNSDIGFELTVYPRNKYLTQFIWNAAIFYSQINNEIVYGFNSQGEGFPSNIGNSEITGIENFFSFELFYETLLTSATTFQIPDNTTHSDNIRYIPGRSILHQTFRLDRRSQKHHIFAEAIYEDGLYYDVANELPAESKLLFNAGYDHQFNKFNIGIMVKNVSDISYKNYYAHHAPGRSFFISAEYETN